MNLKMHDFHTEQRQAMLRALTAQADSLEERRKDAIARMGTRYLCHPVNRIQRRTAPYGEAIRGA